MLGRLWGIGMPKKAKELSAIELRNLTKQGVHAVGGVAGLLLQVGKTDSRSWILRVLVGSKRRDIGLGGYPDVSLALAREKAKELREKIKEGVDPVNERRVAREQLKIAQFSQVTFDEAAKRFLANKKHEFSNTKHASQWAKTLETYASPIIGKLPVAEIELPHIRQILEPIWIEKTETANRVRGRIENVLNWATVSGYRTGENPARWKGHLDNILPKPSKIKKVKHHKALPRQHLFAFIRDLRKREGIAAKALEFLILTAARSGEVRGALWSEIDIKAKLWTIPAERMKAGKEHQVPLSDEVIALINSLPVIEGNEYLFRAPRGGVLSDMALSAVVRRMKVDAVPHGFRSTFRDWCSEETNFPHNVAEMALAHTIGNKVEAAYRRGDLLAKRTLLMEQWAKYCNTRRATGDVLSFKGKQL